MDVYFSKKSLSHIEVDEQAYKIIVCLVNGDKLTVNYFERFRDYLETLKNMLKSYESYSGVVRYDTNTQRLYF